MKKSRIIVPALAMLTLSVAASVTGTVAWFTASRTASMSLKNLVAFSTSGALNMTLNAGNASVNNETKTVTLNAMRDFSYDVDTETGYIAILNSDGSQVTGTRQVPSITAKFGKFGATGVDVYYANTFTATFSTSANVASYLFFNNNILKSHLTKNYSVDNPETDDYIETNSVYRALRVSMTATDTSASSVKKIITWAPYTGATTVLNVNRAATLTSPVDLNVPASTDNYKDGTGAVVTETINVQKAVAGDPITEADRKGTADTSGLLLSKVLIGGTNAVNVNVSFVIWFEGLDPVCLSNSLDVATIAAASDPETITMGFYAIESNAFAA